MQLTFQLSTNCNLRCTYCYQHTKDSAVLTFESAKILLDDLFTYISDPDSSELFYFTVTDSANLKYIDLDFFGGESTLHIDLIDQICSYFITRCNELELTEWLKNYQITVETNGTTFFTPAVYRFYEKYKDHIKLPITIDGCKDCHNKCRKYLDGTGSYDDVERAVLEHTKIFGHCPDTNTKLTFSIDNMSYIKESILNLINLGYTGVRASFDVTAQLTLEQSNDYCRYLKETFDYLIDNKINFDFRPFTTHTFTWGNRDETAVPECGTSGTQLTLNYNNEITFCPHLNASYQGKDESCLIIGKIEDGNIQIDLVTIEYFRQRNLTIEEPECMWCPLRFICTWCPAESLKRGLAWNKPWRQCGVTKAETEALVYFANRAKETNYPYFKETFAEVLEKVYLDPTMNYLIYRQDREREEQEHQQAEEEAEN